MDPPRAEVKRVRNGALHGRAKQNFEKPKPPIQLTYFRKKSATQFKKTGTGAFFGRSKQLCEKPSPSVTLTCPDVGLDSGHFQTSQKSREVEHNQVTSSSEKEEETHAGKPISTEIAELEAQKVSPAVVKSMSETDYRLQRGLSGVGLAVDDPLEDGEALGLVFIAGEGARAGKGLGSSPEETSVTDEDAGVPTSELELSPKLAQISPIRA